MHEMHETEMEFPLSYWQSRQGEEFHQGCCRSRVASTEALQDHQGPWAAGGHTSQGHDATQRHRCHVADAIGQQAQQV